MAKLIDI